MGILHLPKNVGVFPDCDGAPECSPDAIICNVATFKNYPGVENQAITSDEMEEHIDKEHLVFFEHSSSSRDSSKEHLPRRQS